jgi:ATP-dependent DNA helicase DinG
MLTELLVAARALPGEGWQHRLSEDRPLHAAENFLAQVRRQSLARSPDREGAFGIETEARPPLESLLPAAVELEAALARLARPFAAIVRLLEDRLDDEAADLDTGMRLRIEAMIRSLTRRGDNQIGGWRRMLSDLAKPLPAEFVDWLSLERYDGLEHDVGMHRHWVDPTVPFIETVAKPAHGVVVTSATLTDGGGEAEGEEQLAGWTVAEARTGARHLEKPAWRARVASPFDYKAQTKVFIVTDVRRDDPRQVAAAYRSLFVASGGGALGLFTAITRLRAVHERIAAPLEGAGLPLLAQHVDAMDTATLIDIFRAEENSCLLGTDAVRDGVDVPGRSLRLIVFDRVPWPRPDILHKARKAAFGGARYDDMLTRLRLRQAYGRLIRRATDTGVFVLLDSAFPTRLHAAFPPGVMPQRVGLAEAVEQTAAFLEHAAKAGA